MFRIFFAAFVFLGAFGCASKRVAKNHIFFMVDGMGPAHITGARMFKGGPEARLNLEKMPFTGFVRTYSSDDFTTDSAAAATAYATGRRTYNKAIGVIDDKLDSSAPSSDLVTIVDRAKAAGKSVGLVTTARITHATPAAYYAHVTHRDLEESIAEQLLHSEIDLIIGGGRRFFVGTKDGGIRQDQRNLLDEFSGRGYLVVKSDQELKRLRNNPSKQKTIALLEEDHLPYDLERVEPQASLEELVDHAIQVLSQNPQGYFLLVEAARIDLASHANLARHAFGDMLAFDRALERAFVEDEKQTLIVVTADHETGGLALNGYAPYEAASGEKILGNRPPDAKSKEVHGFVSWASGPGYGSSVRVNEKNRNFLHKAAYQTPHANHTAVDVPVMARGPGAEKFVGFLDNVEIVHKVIEIMNLKPLE